MTSAPIVAVAKSLAELTKNYRENYLSQILQKLEASESHWRSYRNNQTNESKRKHHLSMFMTEIQPLKTTLFPQSLLLGKEMKDLSNLLFLQNKGKAIQPLIKAFTTEYLSQLGECDARLNRITDCIENKQAPLITQHINPLKEMIQESRNLLTEIQTMAGSSQSGGGSAMSCFVKKDVLDKDYKDWLKSKKVYPAPASASASSSRASSRRQSFSAPVPAFRFRDTNPVIRETYEYNPNNTYWGQTIISADNGEHLPVAEIHLDTKSQSAGKAKSRRRPAPTKPKP